MVMLDLSVAEMQAWRVRVVFRSGGTDEKFNRTPGRGPKPAAQSLLLNVSVLPPVSSVVPALATPLTVKL